MGVEYRVFGPPGTGKTSDLVRRIGAAVERHGASGVLVASFTRAAAATIAARGLAHIPREQMGTLHALGRRALGGDVRIAEQYTREWNRGFPAWRLSVKGDFSDDPEDDAGTVESPARRAKAAGDAAYDQVGLLRARRVPVEAWPDLARAFWARWAAWKRENGLVDYADLIALPLERRLPPPGSPRVAFYDEAQDFTAAEAALVRFWGEGMESYTLSGDARQCIYTFKGADPDVMLDPPLPDGQREILGQSYRVPRRVQAYAEAWIAGLSRHETVPYRPRDEEGEVRFAAAEAPGGSYRAPEPLLEHARRYLDAGRGVMFLASCNYMLDPLLAVLRARGVPFHNPYRQREASWNPLAPLRDGVSGAERLLAFLRPDPAAWGAYARPWGVRDLLAWLDALDDTRVLAGPEARLEIERLHAEAEDRPEVLDRPLTVAAHLGRWLRPEALEPAWAGSLSWFEAHLRQGAEGALDFPLRVARAGGPAALRATPRVIVGTVHSVKGGEADCVYLLGDLSATAALGWHFPADPERAGARDEVLRLFYVGMTRAREALVLVPPLAAAKGVEFPPHLARGSYLSAARPALG